MTDVILDPFHRALAYLINTEIERRSEALINGSASRIAEDTASVAEKYAAAVSYIVALRTVLEMAKQVEMEQHQIQPRNAKVDVRER